MLFFSGNSCAVGFYFLVGFCVSPTVTLFALNMRVCDYREAAGFSTEFMAPVFNAFVGSTSGG